MEIKFQGTIKEILLEIKEFLNNTDIKQELQVQEEKYFPILEDIPGEAEAYENEDLKASEKLVEANNKEPLGLTVPKFDWDGNELKKYKNIDFCELENGNVMLFYMGSRLFTTKEIVMKIPFPIPYGYSKLNQLNSSKKTAIKMYREYLNNKIQQVETQQKPPENSEDKIPNKLEVLKQKAKINKNRWDKDNLESKVKPKTKELHDMIVKMGIT